MECVFSLFLFFFARLWAQFFLQKPGVIMTHTKTAIVPFPFKMHICTFAQGIYASSATLTAYVWFCFIDAFVLSFLKSFFVCNVLTKCI